MTEPIAWVAAIVAGAATLFGVYALTRPMRGGFLKLWLRAVTAVALLLPAPVPGFDAHYAPAFVVVLFEAALQRDGQPGVAAGLLVAGIATVTAIVGAYFYWRSRGQARERR